MKRFLKVAAIIVCISMITGCASIICGRTQRLPVVTKPDNATVTINGMVQKSPCVILLDRNIPSYNIKIEKEGFQPYEFTLKRGINGWTICNAIFGLCGLIGVVIDCANGSIHQFYPGEIEANLVPEGQEALIIKTK